MSVLILVPSKKPAEKCDQSRKFDTYYFVMQKIWECFIEKIAEK